MRYTRLLISILVILSLINWTKIQRSIWPEDTLNSVQTAKVQVIQSNRTNQQEWSSSDYKIDTSIHGEQFRAQEKVLELIVLQRFIDRRTKLSIDKQDFGRSTIDDLALFRSGLQFLCQITGCTMTATPGADAVSHDVIAVCVRLDSGAMNSELANAGIRPGSLVSTKSISGNYQVSLSFQRNI